MSISKPFFRITRPKAYIPNYVKDIRYASDKLQLIRAYVNLENELKSIFNYIEPDEDNEKTFSFKLYSLLLLACTEVEVNCKLIMSANGYLEPKSMKDYKKLENSSKLSKYVVTYSNWKKFNKATNEIEYIKKEYTPFKEFANNKSPCWYQEYNDVKHDREKNFKYANLDNCMNAVSAVLVLLHSQFGNSCSDSSMSLCLDEGYDDIYLSRYIFEIKPPKIGDWNNDELYDFEWDDIKNDSMPFEKFPFHNI